MTKREWLMQGFQDGWLNIADMVRITQHHWETCNYNHAEARADWVWACTFAARDEYADGDEHPGT